MEKGRGRASVFGDLDESEIDISGFAPKPIAALPQPTQEQVKAVSEAANFPSRQAPAATKASPPREKRTQRRYRTGRNVQFNAKASQETIDRFYALCDQNPGWVMGYTLERAVEALEREMKQANSSAKQAPSAIRQPASRQKERLDA